jgi:Protein of unknown function (DUF1524)/Excalibur calcium-binding domain
VRAEAPERTATPQRRAARSGTALAALETLTVKGRAPKTGYGREQFGTGWVSINDCDMLHRVLKRDLRRKSYEPGSRCEVERGRLADPYTATAIEYVHGGAAEVDVDHVVALGDAWQKGAQQWTYARRVAFANDPLNLLATDSSANRQKGAADAASWLPPNRSFRCEYVARQIAVKQRYRAWVTAAEHNAMRRVLTACPQTRLPVSGRFRLPVRARTPARPEPGAFASCAAARAAGRAPLSRGDPGYGTHLDGDADGVACER